ncbi:hypothetical protein H6G52_03805 [Limnothrix sp. FACHB-881]|uniref:hypothetical protein n=1 Tax=Limnothrix sp. FACHB-881 TaxID=2692819 RepID=UPI00168805DB|nr:hypothetical protein [Limnothrix sp. FACHB-881]MBD2634476.1 hypothetical protein [Limnothrix sp. FACHB-881]
MPEENTAENKIPVPPDQSFPDLEEGELSEEDLEAAAGGTLQSSSVAMQSQIANNTSVSIRDTQQQMHLGEFP